MSYSDYQAGRSEAQFSNIMAGMRADDNAQRWASYARQLEARLAQAQAETLAARIQRNAYRDAAVKLSGIDETTYRTMMGRTVIQPELARNGLQVDAQGNVTRTRR